MLDEREVLRAAQDGYARQIEQTYSKLAELQNRLMELEMTPENAVRKVKQAKSAAAMAATVTTKRTKKSATRTMSPEGRARIIAAQKKRWLAVKKGAKNTAKK